MPPSPRARPARGRRARAGPGSVSLGLELLASACLLRSGVVRWFPMQNKFCPFSPGYQYDNRSATDPIGYFTKLGIAFVSWWTLSGWPLHNTGAISPKDDPHVAAIATRLRRTPTQVLLRWALQHGAAVIPTSRTHAADNAAVFNFVLDEAHMATISGLSWFFATDRNEPQFADVLGVQEAATS